MSIMSTAKLATEANYIEFAKAAEERGIDLHTYANLVRVASVFTWLSILAVVAFFSLTAGLIVGLPVIWFIYMGFIGAAAIDRYADM